MRTLLTALLILAATFPAAAQEDSPKSVWDAIPGAGVKRDAAGEVVELDLRKCEPAWLIHVDQLAAAKKLRNLKVAGPAVGDAAVAKICEATQLRALSLQQCGVTDAGCGPLAKLEDLKELSLFGCPAGAGALESLAGLDSLAKLNLRATAVADGDLAQHLPALESLVSLELSETAVGDESIPAILKLPELVDLNLWKTRVTDAGVERLVGMKLERLNLDDNRRLTDAAAASAAQIPTLVFLHLGKTGVTDAAVAILAERENLQELRLNDTAVTPEAVERLRAKRPALKVVY